MSAVERAIRELVKALREELAREQGIANTNRSRELSDQGDGSPGHGDQEYPCLRLPVSGNVSRGGIVYFLRCRGPGTPIKIGYAKDVARRVHNLQMGSPYTIDLVAYFWSPDPEEEEAKLHRLFDEHRIRGEWFNPAPHLLELIKHHAGSVVRALAG